MGRIQNTKAGINPATQDAVIGSSDVERVAMLQPKGTCWYCDRLVDNVRRFCSVSCRHDYFEEEEGGFANS